MRATTFAALHGRSESGLTATQRVILAAIVAAVVLAIVGTEPTIPHELEDAIELAEIGFGVLFFVEYVARVWSIGERPEFAGVAGRLRYMAKPLVIIDLLALLPFVFGLIGGESLLLRSIRALRLLALSKMLRYSQAMRVVVSAVVERRFELFFAVTLATLMILLSSAVLYLVEGSRQPEAFGSIPRAMWWSVITLTTVGYGDAVPLTWLGKIFAGITAVAGIGMIAMPTGILAASFSDGFAKARAMSARESNRDGGRIDSSSVK